ncbi:MAG: hypothetical protein ABI576_20745 [Flavobacterium sp.]
MKNSHFIIIILFSSFLFSQNKVITPKFGTFIFDKKEIITDNQLYQASVQKLKKNIIPALKESIVKEILTDNKKIDTTQLNMMIRRLDDNFDQMLNIGNPNEKIKFHLKLNDSLITKFQIINDYTENEEIINIKSGLIQGSEYNVDDDSVEVIKLQEFKNKTKVIHGFKCFKIILIYKENEHVFSDFMRNYTHYREMWVTDKIKLLYHPVINQKEILEKYYPLQIIEYSDALKGFTTNYELEILKLN